MKRFFCAVLAALMVGFGGCGESQSPVEPGKEGIAVRSQFNAPLQGVSQGERLSYMRVSGPTALVGVGLGQDGQGQNYVLSMGGSFGTAQGVDLKVKAKWPVPTSGMARNNFVHIGGVDRWGEKEVVTVGYDIQFPLVVEDRWELFVVKGDEKIFSETFLPGTGKFYLKTRTLTVIGDVAYITVSRGAYQWELWEFDLGSRLWERETALPQGFIPERSCRREDGGVWIGGVNGPLFEVVAVEDGKLVVEATSVTSSSSLFPASLVEARDGVVLSGNTPSGFTNYRLNGATLTGMGTMTAKDGKSYISATCGTAFGIGGVSAGWVGQATPFFWVWAGAGEGVAHYEFDVGAKNIRVDLVLPVPGGMMLFGIKDGVPWGAHVNYDPENDGIGANQN